MPETAAKQKLASPDQVKAAYDNWLPNAYSAMRAAMKPMSTTLSRVLMVATFSEADGEPVPEDVTKQFCYQVLAMRLNSLDCKLTPWALTMAAAVCQSPGDAVMYAHVLAYKAREDKRELTNLSQFVHLFPMGFPDRETLGKIWDTQKGFYLGLDGVDNMLDMVRVK